MFNEEGDWSDEDDARTLSKSLFKHSQKPKEEQKDSSEVKPKVVGKKSLLRTLQTLGSVPEWKSDDRQQDSDSEAEATPTHPKKKKKRGKKRRHAKKSTEMQENGDVEEEGDKEEKPEVKKGKKSNKVGSQKLKTTPAVEEKVEGITKSVDVNKSEDAEKLSRKQWKNKMKNKRNCKNKYRLNNPEVKEGKTESVQKAEQKEEATAESRSNSSSQKDRQATQTKQKKGTERKAQKRKKTEEENGVSHTPETKTPKQLTEKETKVIEECEPTHITEDQQHLPVKRLKPELSRDQILKREKLRKMLQSQEKEHKETPVEKTEEAVKPPEEPEVKLDRSASLRSRMEQRLESARFRYINEVLYSTTSGEARRMFKQDPDAFWVYHRGYTAQVQRWPSNPVDAIIKYIQQKPPSLVVADFGCGDCKIARSVKNKVHSFDLAPTCELVTVCDMAKVPLADRSVDIAVFCLSLMGTNLADFLAEANRVLKMRGVLKVAEVASRFDNVRNFLTALSKLGFKMLSKDTENTHFYSFEFEKTGNAPDSIKKFGLELKACVYKKR